MSGGDWKQMFKGVQENDLELVKYYLNAGIDVNYQHPEYLALPISESIRYGHIEIMILLLMHKANPHIKELESGCTAVELAQQKGNQRAIDLLKCSIWDQA